MLAGRVALDEGTDPDFGIVRYNADGSLDTTFGAAFNGIIRSDFGKGSWEEASDVTNWLAIQSDGKIVVVGQSANTSVNPDFAVARYLPTGVLDATFGTAGKVTVDFFGAIDGATGVVVQPDRRIAVGGFARNAGSIGFAMARLLP